MVLVGDDMAAAAFLVCPARLLPDVVNRPDVARVSPQGWKRRGRGSSRAANADMIAAGKADAGGPPWIFRKMRAYYRMMIAFWCIEVHIQADQRGEWVSNTVQHLTGCPTRRHHGMYRPGALRPAAADLGRRDPRGMTSTRTAAPADPKPAA
ncbi:hypothetical protein ACFQ4K_19915 [Tistrella bauzanensis]